MFGSVFDVLLLLCISVWEVSVGTSSRSLTLSLADESVDEPISHLKFFFQCFFISDVFF